MNTQVANTAMTLNTPSKFKLPPEASIFAVLDASHVIERTYRAAGLDRLCQLTPHNLANHRGNWASKSLPFVFGTLWLLAATGYIQQASV